MMAQCFSIYFLLFSVIESGVLYDEKSFITKCDRHVRWLVTTLRCLPYTWYWQNVSNICLV